VPRGARAWRHASSLRADGKKGKKGKKRKKGKKARRAQIESVVQEAHDLRLAH